MGETILVIGEAKDGVLRHVTFEAIAAAKKINDQAEIVGVLCGDNALSSQAEEMIRYGVDRVVVVEHEKLSGYTSEGYGQAIMAVIQDVSPDGIVMGHTAIGKDLTPKIASKLDSGLISDVIDIEIADQDIVFTRPIYSGKAFEKKIITDGLTFVTVRPNNIVALERDESLTGDIETKDVEITNLRTIIKEVIRKTSEGVDMSEANVIVAGGRGVKRSEEHTSELQSRGHIECLLLRER